VDTAVVVFNRDLRVHDHPALARAAVLAARIVPVFVVDPAMTASAGSNRMHFLLESLHDLRLSLRARGGELFVRHGDPAVEAFRVASSVDARTVVVSADVSAVARRREDRLEAACAGAGMTFERLPGVTVVAPDALEPSSGRDHYQVFTPYWRAWLRMPWRGVVAAPDQLEVPGRLASGRIPAPPKLTVTGRSSTLPRGGETEGRRILESWVHSESVHAYETGADDLARDATSRLSPYLRFGCVSPLEVASRVRGCSPGGDAFVRQLCWRDFHHQVTYAFPRINELDYRPKGNIWRNDADAFAAWAEGRTGYPIVDAGMRQLRAEGWMHNRARMITASFLTKDLQIDWRLGARHFAAWLVDGDVPDNYGNWQWVAGTGNDRRPNRVLNPVRQARRFDPAGEYVRRWIPELATIDGPAVHEPWRLPAEVRGRLRYPAPIVDHDSAVAELAGRARPVSL